MRVQRAYACTQVCVSDVLARVQLYMRRVPEAHYHAQINTRDNMHNCFHYNRQGLSGAFHSAATPLQKGGVAIRSDLALHF